MKKLFYISLVACMTCTVPVMGQSSFSVQYSMGTGSGNTKSFVSAASFRGVALEFRHMVQPKIGVGFDIGWNVFYERKAYDTYSSGTASLSGVQYRYINAVPIYIAADYYFKPDQKVNPFVGLGVGTMGFWQNTDMGLYTVEVNSWALAFRPEAGIRLEMNPATDIILAAKYNYGLSTSALSAQSYFTFNVGLVFKKN
jgi:outer membrane protein W